MKIRFLKQCLVGTRVYRPCDEADFDDVTLKKSLVASGVAEWHDPEAPKPKKRVADVHPKIEVR